MKAMLALLLALAWAPLTSHCLLENVPGLGFLGCAASLQTSPANPAHCADTGCCSVENASVLVPALPPVVPLSVFALLPLAVAVDCEPVRPPQPALGLFAAAPPELSTAWQFSSRTALPPRAPSFVS